MKNLLAAVLVILVGGVAFAGPNAGGTLIAHNTGALYTSGSLPCSDGTDPSDCTQAVTRVEVESADYPAIFQVYAVFLASRSPRLMGVTWGVNYDPAKLKLGGPSNCADFELPDASWPAPGSGNSLTWDTVQTGHIVKMYGFYAYTYNQNACTFALTPNPSQDGYFGDDAVPAALDPIAGFSSLGFHTDGVPVCPSDLPSGACCAQDRTCSYGFESACQAPSVWQGDWTVCSPSPCHPFGACCAADGSCSLVPQLSCLLPNLWHGEWPSCSPNPCPQLGACCTTSGSCRVLYQINCVSPSVWYGQWTSCNADPCADRGACCRVNGSCSLQLLANCTSPSVWYSEWTSCSPNPCPQGEPGGACCTGSGFCTLVMQFACSGTWHDDWPSCSPNPCPQPTGACCLLDNTCILVTQAECTGWWRGAGTPCPDPCYSSPPASGACCLADGSCIYVLQVNCGGIWHSGFDCTTYQCPPPSPGACCDPATNHCTITLPAECAHIWLGAGTLCDFTVCSSTPVKHRSWGQIKAGFRATRAR